MSPSIIAHLFSTFFLTGLIWIVQLVHYPGFHFVEANDFVAFEKFHTNRISAIVIPLMFCELLTGAYLFFLPNVAQLMKISIILIALIWLSTFILSVPIHGKLAMGKDTELINKLVTTNWPRTILWSIRSGLLIFLIFKGKI